MTRKYFLNHILPVLFTALACILQPGIGNAQRNTEKPLLKIDFGTIGKHQHTFQPGKKYLQEKSACPAEGEFSLAPYTVDCFNHHWVTVRQDHTAGDVNGRMMIVNSTEKPGTFLSLQASRFKPGVQYEISAWVVNICKTAADCFPALPNISFVITSGSEQSIASFNTGNIPPTGNADWMRFYGVFSVPQGTTSVNIQFDNNTAGACGNDFAIDDIVIKEYTGPVNDPMKKESLLNTVLYPSSNEKVLLPLPAEQPLVPAAIITESVKPAKVVEEKPVSGKLLTVNESTTGVLKERTNTVARQLYTQEGELTFELYDNGAIDGDTVSIYHNNQLIVNAAELSDKPIRFSVKVNAASPHHELIIAANNLGSIPPNTSLLIVTVNGARNEIFISSSKENNARVLIDLQQ